MRFMVLRKLKLGPDHIKFLKNQNELKLPGLDPQKTMNQISATRPTPS